MVTSLMNKIRLGYIKTETTTTITKYIELGLISRMKMCGMCDGNYVVELPKFVVYER